MNALSLLELARYWARPRERAPIGTPEARVEVWTARGKRYLTPKTSGGRPAATSRHDATDQGPRR